MINIGSRLKITAAFLALLLVAAVLLPFTAEAAGTTITEYPVLTVGSTPSGITSGPDHALWFTENAGNQIGRIDSTTHAVAEYPTPTIGSAPAGITSGPDGALWFTENGVDKIGRIDPSTHTVTEYGLTAGSRPFGITSGPDGALWFTEAGVDKIGRIDPSTHAVHEYGALAASSGPVGITSGPDGALWFTEANVDKIGRIDPTTHAVHEYGGLAASSHPWGITSGSDGALWFTEYNGNRIGRIDPTTHAVHEYGGLAASSHPWGITSGPDGAIWFTEQHTDKIGRIDPTTHTIHEYGLTAGSGPSGITSGPDGALWFTEYNGNRIGRVSIPFTINASVSGGHGTVSPATQTVNSAGTATININPNSGYHTTSVTDNGAPVTPTPTTSYTINKMAANHTVVATFAFETSAFYFAEGSTRTNFQEYLCMGNSGDKAASAQVTYLFTDGTTKDASYTVPANSRYTVDVNSVVGPNKDLSLKVLSDSPNLVAERPMYFNYNGQWTGGHDAVGATAPNTKWYFAEGNTLPEFDQYVTVLNPGDAAANLKFHYMVEGQGEKDVPEQVGAHSRATFKTRDQIGNGKNVSLYLESTKDVVAERPMYFNYLGLAQNNWTGGHDVVGTNSPNTDWYFAEGTTRKNSVDGAFEQWLCLQNPGTAPLTVSATYQLAAGQGNPVSKTYTVPAQQRRTVSVNREIGQDKDCSVYLHSTSDFIAERPMYFSYHTSAWTGGHDVLGVNSTATTWFFGEGTTRTNFEEWLCLQNPGNSDAHTTITYYTTSGQVINKSWTVKANTRLTVSANNDVGANQDISTKVSSDKPIIVERPMYFNYNGWTGGHDVVGFVPSP